MLLPGSHAARVRRQAAELLVRRLVTKHHIVFNGNFRSVRVPVITEGSFTCLLILQDTWGATLP